VVSIWAIKMYNDSGCVLGKSDVADSGRPKKKKIEKKSLFRFKWANLVLGSLLQ